MTMMFTKPERAKLAKLIEGTYYDVTGHRRKMVERVGFRDELGFRMEDFITVNGVCRWCHVSVDHRGLDIHIKFADAKRALPNCAGINPYSGKWNHYIWPSAAAKSSGADLFAMIEQDARFVFERLRQPGGGGQ